MALRERLLADYDHEIASTRRLLTRLPDERLAWTPHVRSRPLAALATHIIEILGWAVPILTAPSFDLEALPAPLAPLPSGDAIVRAFDAAASRTRSDMNRSDAEYKAAWRLKRANSELFVLPREAAFRAFVLHHIIHHRGQLSVYLRLADVALPAIYGPTADLSTQP